MRKFLVRALHSISLRVPQRYALRSGLRVFVYSKQQHNLFWTLFSSPEYIQFLRSLLTLKQLPMAVVDGGAACGYFSLLIEHYIRCSLLPWSISQYILVEPMKSNLKMLRLNTETNFNERSTINAGVLGKKSGHVSFQRSVRHPWGGRVVADPGGNSIHLPYIDITDSISKDWCLVKLDIEGSEFDFVDTYRDDLDKVVAFIIEWHTERGSYETAVATLKSRGFNSRKKVVVTSNRWLELFLNEKCE